MQALRTPDERFINLPGFNFTPHYLQVSDSEGGELRLHYLDEGAADDAVGLDGADRIGANQGVQILPEAHPDQERLGDVAGPVHVEPAGQLRPVGDLEPQRLLDPFGMAGTQGHHQQGLTGSSDRVLGDHVDHPGHLGVGADHHLLARCGHPNALADVLQAQR